MTDLATGRPVRALAARAWGSAPLLLVTASLFWALNPIVGRAARDLITPVALSFWRWAIALIAVIAFASPHLRRDALLIRAHWKILLTLGMIGTAVFAPVVYWSLQHTTAVNNLMMQSAMPPMILAMSAILLRDRISWPQIAGTLVSLAGLLTIVARGDIANLISMQFNKGDAASLLAVFFYALYSALLRKRPPIHPLSLLAVLFGIGAAVLALPYGAEIASGRYMAGTPETWLSIVFVGVFPSLLCYFFFNRSVELIGAARAGQYMNLPPVFGIGLAILLLGEPFEIFHATGAVLVAIGVTLAGKDWGGRAAPSAAPAAR